MERGQTPNLWTLLSAPLLLLFLTVAPCLTGATPRPCSPMPPCPRSTCCPEVVKKDPHLPSPRLPAPCLSPLSVLFHRPEAEFGRHRRAAAAPFKSPTTPTAPGHADAATSFASLSSSSPPIESSRDALYLKQAAARIGFLPRRPPVEIFTSDNDGLPRA